MLTGKNVRAVNPPAPVAAARVGDSAQPIQSTAANQSAAANQNAATKVKTPAKSSSATTEWSLNLSSAKGSKSFAQGETISLLAQSNASGYLYCYFTDAQKNVQRFFPNRFETDNFIAAGNALRLPGKMPFDITAEKSAHAESITCFATQDNVYHRLPSHIRAYDFETLSIKSVNDVRKGFRTASSGSVAEAQFIITVN